MTRPLPILRLLAAAALLAACGPDADPADAPPAGVAATTDAPAAGVPGSDAEDGPPLGRYVCRQGMTTMGYLTLEGDAYEVSGVRGGYRYDPATGAMNWEGGSYDEWGWDGTYEHVARPAGDGRPDEDVIRIVGEADGLKIDCYRMAEG